MLVLKAKVVKRMGTCPPPLSLSIEKNLQKVLVYVVLGYIASFPVSITCLKQKREYEMPELQPDGLKYGIT